MRELSEDEFDGDSTIQDSHRRLHEAINRRIAAGDNPFYDPDDDDDDDMSDLDPDIRASTWESAFFAEREIRDRMEINLRKEKQAAETWKFIAGVIGFLAISIMLATCHG